MFEAMLNIVIINILWAKNLSNCIPLQGGVEVKQMSKGKLDLTSAWSFYHIIIPIKTAMNSITL